MVSSIIKQGSNRKNKKIIFKVLRGELFSLLKTNDVYFNSHPIIPFCQACHNGPKPIKTVQQNQQFLASILPTIQNQLPKQEFTLTFLANQDKPTSWNSVQEVWIDPEYQGGSFLCRFCVPLRTHPKYRKFYLFDNRFFYLDKKWAKAAQEYYWWEQEFKQRLWSLHYCQGCGCYQWSRQVKLEDNTARYCLDCLANYPHFWAIKLANQDLKKLWTEQIKPKFWGELQKTRTEF